jgi:hypothetical protein
MRRKRITFEEFLLLAQAFFKGKKAADHVSIVLKNLHVHTTDESTLYFKGKNYSVEFENCIFDFPFWLDVERHIKIKDCEFKEILGITMADIEEEPHLDIEGSFVEQLYVKEESGLYECFLRDTVFNSLCLSQVVGGAIGHDFWDIEVKQSLDLNYKTNPLNISCDQRFAPMVRLVNPTVPISISFTDYVMKKRKRVK